jgi:hypothetical protein
MSNWAMELAIKAWYGEPLPPTRSPWTSEVLEQEGTQRQVRRATGSQIDVALEAWYGCADAPSRIETSDREGGSLWKKLFRK